MGTNPPGGHLEKLGEVLNFLRLVWAIEHLLKSTSKRMQKSLGVTGPQRLVIRIVEQFPGIGAKDLAEVLHLHPSTLTVILERLWHRRLIIREQDPLDGRRIRLYPVPGASEVRRAPTVEGAVRKAFDAVTPVKVRHACEMLEALVRSLEEHQQGQAARMARRSPASGAASAAPGSARRRGARSRG